MDSLYPDPESNVINKSFPGEGMLSKQVAIYIIINGILSTSWSIWKMLFFCWRAWLWITKPHKE
jgi:hypothetical protein